MLLVLPPKKVFSPLLFDEKTIDKCHSPLLWQKKSTDQPIFVYIHSFIFLCLLSINMKKLVTLFFLLSVSLCTFSQSVQSPEQFLGYKLGDRFTQHYKIVNYFKSVAQSVPDIMKLEQYGETYEGRPLLLAFISSKENMAKLESLRMNNLRLANSTKDKAAPVEDGIIFVWLSYNVHGNEP